MKRSTTLSVTSPGLMPLAEQKRMKDDRRWRTSEPSIFAFSACHSSISGAPCSGTPFSRAR